METLYEKYKNIQKFITKYRKYQLTDDSKFLDYKTFKKTMQIEQYVKHKCINPQKNNISVYIYLFKNNSKFVKTTAQFKRLIDKLPEENANVIVISKDDLSIYITKALLKYKHLRVFNYKHKYFSIEISKGPFCSPHRILSDNEVRQLCSRELIIHPLSLPAIPINDAQNIWIGGELGDIIEIDSVSEITGKTIHYRIVSPIAGKISNNKKVRQKINKYHLDKPNVSKAEQKVEDIQQKDEISAYIDDDTNYDDDEILQ